MPIRREKEEVTKMPMVLLRVFPEEEVNEALYLINHRPRKCLGWKISWVTYPRSGIHL